MKTVVRVEYIPSPMIWSGEVKVVSERLSELHNNPDVTQCDVEYLTKDGKITGVIITYYVKVQDGGLNYVR